MSEVRMCDSCGAIFSMLADDWATYQGTRVVRGDDGRQRTLTEARDTGPCCAAPTVKTPRAAAITASAGVDRIAQTQTQEDRDRVLHSTPNDETPF